MLHKHTAVYCEYYELLIQGKTRFGLDEIDPEKFRSLSTNFVASGSNRNIATVIWYFTVIQLRNEFNPGAIHFPIVFDSPKNVEMDSQKEGALLEYLIKNAELSAQFIVSGLGYNSDEFKRLTEESMNIIELDANHGLRTPLARSFSPTLTAK